MAILTFVLPGPIKGRAKQHEIRHTAFADYSYGHLFEGADPKKEYSL
jgi:hypothetical protein